MKKIIGITIAVLILIGIFLGLIEIGVLFFYGERQLSQAFIDEFDLSKLDPMAVYDYWEENGGYHILGHWGMNEDGCRFNLPPEPQCWVNEVILIDRQYVIEEPYYKLKWHFQLPPEKPYGDNVQAVQQSKSFFAGYVTVIMTNGSADAFVCGNSIQQCQEIAEEKLLEVYRTLVENGAVDQP